MHTYFINSNPNNFVEFFQPYSEHSETKSS